MTGGGLYPRLIALRDEKYRDFQARLIPTVDKQTMIGVRTPELRRIAKDIYKSGESTGFMRALPHGTFEENQIHAFLIGMIKDPDECLEKLEAFLPYIDNWATCDQMGCGALKKRPEKLLVHARRWLESGGTYTVRFGIKVHMDCFLGELFDPKQPEYTARIDSGEYYIKTMQAWYFATALAKRWDETADYIKERKLSPEVAKMTVKKALESFRVSEEHKALLKEWMKNESR